MVPLEQHPCSASGAHRLLLVRAKPNQNSQLKGNFIKSAPEPSLEKVSMSVGEEDCQE